MSTTRSVLNIRRGIAVCDDRSIIRHNGAVYYCHNIADVASRRDGLISIHLAVQTIVISYRILANLITTVSKTGVVA